MSAGTLPDTWTAPPRLASGSLFDRASFTALARAMHPGRRFPTAVSQLKVGLLDHQPDVATAWVYGAYATVLGRLPDPEGLRTYEAHLRNGGSPTDLVARLAASSEASNAAPETAVEFDEVFVTGAYLVALGRRPDVSGAALQREAIGAGARHEDLLAGLLRSPEAERQMRFPPSAPSMPEHLARAVQLLVAGDVDDTVQHVLVQAVRDGRSNVWLVRTALRLRRGRRALLRPAPRWWWLGQLARHRAERQVLIAALESSNAWNWRVQRRVLDSVGALQRDVAALKVQRPTGS
jgi:hypothetical protein